MNKPSLTAKEIFELAHEISSPAERSFYLDQACAGDTALGRRCQVSPPSRLRYSATGAGRPRSRCVPSARKRTPSGTDAFTASRVLSETTTCPPCPTEQIRAVA